MRKDIFVTGATGFIGAHFVSIVARDPEVHVHCVVRPSRRQSAQQRLDALFGPLGIDDHQRRIVAVEGDLKSIGTDALRGDVEELAPKISAIFHFAADINFAVPIERSRRTNVEDLRCVLSFARRCRSANPNFSHYAHVSTAFVAGRRRDLVRESDLQHDKGFKNNYEQSKYEGELLVREFARDVPAIVYRPSIVIGASVNGRVEDGNTLYPILRQIQRHRPRFILANGQARLDMVDVRYVAEAMAAISNDPKNIGGVFHLAAGSGREVIVKDIIHLIERQVGRRMWLLPYRLYLAVVRPVLNMRKDDRYRSVIRFADAYSSYFDANPSFDVERARRATAAAGLTMQAPMSLLEASLQAVAYAPRVVPIPQVNEGTAP